MMSSLERVLTEGTLGRDARIRKCEAREAAKPPSVLSAGGFLEMDVVIRGVQQILEWLLKKFPEGTEGHFSLLLALSS
jgi:hypothetical protein